jgi:hypothetical protein
MFKVSIISVVVLPLTATCVLAQANTMTSGRPSAALNPEQCEAIWKNAVPSGDLLAKEAAAPFIVNFTQVDKDGSLLDTSRFVLYRQTVGASEDLELATPKGAHCTIVR